MNKKSMQRRVPQLVFIFAVAASIAWLAFVQSMANHLSALATGAAPAGVTATVDVSSSDPGAGLRRKLSLPNPSSVAPQIHATQARDEAPLLQIDLPEYKELPLKGPILAWEVEPRRRIDQKDAPLPATLCSCDKCGSTSFYNTLYEMTHGKPWTYDGEPWIQDLSNVERWTDVHAARKKDWDNFAGVKGSEIGTNSFALVRDPKERILSAWKSKIQCSLEGRDGDWKFVYHLLKHAGMNKSTTKGLKVPRVGPKRSRRARWEPCLDVSTFLQVMFNIHLQGKQGLVNGHFRPQHLWCFAHAPPEKWTHVVTAKSLDAACRLESVVMGKDSHTRGEDCAMEKRHATKDISAYANLTAVDMMLLDAITREEYEVLGPYL